MTSTKRVQLSWTGRGLVFEGGEPGGPRIVLDGDGKEGPSSTTTLLVSLASCMSMDIRHILEKSRVPVVSLDAEVTGVRAEEPPRRFESVRMVFSVEGPREEDQDRLERALSLSRSTYCSVLHSLRSDIDVELDIRRR